MPIEKQINVVISAVDQYSGGMSAFGSSIGAIGKAALAAQAALIAASVAAAKLGYELGKDAFKSAVDFHDAIYDITSVAQSMGTTAEDVTEVLNGMVAKFPVTGKEAGETLKLIAQLGYGAKDALIEASDAATTLSIATGTDVASAASYTLSVMNAFGDSVDSYDQVINVFAKTAATSAASVYDLGDAMKYAAPAAKLSGISFEETAAALAELRNKGLKAEQTGTTLRMALLKLSQETDAGEKVLAKYGLTYDDVNPKVNTLAEVIGKFQGQTLEAKDAAELFGVEAASVSLIINDGAAKFQSYVDEITGTSAAYDAMEKKMKKWSVTIDMIGGDLDVFKNVIGSDLVAAAVELIGTSDTTGLRGIVKQLREFEEASGDIGGPLMEAFNDIKAVGKGVLEDAFGDVEGLYKWIGLIADALATNIEVLGIWVGEFTKGFVDASDDSNTLRVALQAVNVAIAGLAIPIAVVLDAFFNFFEWVEKGIESIDYAWAAWNAGVLIGVKKIAQAADALPFVDMGDTISNLEQQIAGWSDSMENAFSPSNFTSFTESAISAFGKATVAVSDLKDESELMAGGVKKATDASKELSQEQIKAAIEAGEAFEVINGKMVKVKEETTDWGKELEGAGIIVNKEKEYMGELKKETEGATTKAKKLKDELSEMEKHQLELDMKQFEHDLEMAKIDLTKKFDLLEKELEIEAKIDIAAMEKATKIAEAQAEKTKAAFDSISDSVVSATDASASMFDALSGASGVKFLNLKDLYKDQQELQKALTESQIELTEEQKKQIELQNQQQKIANEKLQKGQLNPIEVQVIGNTETWLKGLMQSLFEEIMVKAQAEAFSCMCQQ